MSESPSPAPDGSYGELLGEYFSVATDLAPMLEETGVQNSIDDEYESLRERMEELRAAVERECPDHETTEIEAMLDEAFDEANT